MERLNQIRSKIYSWDHLQRQLALWRFKDKKIVFSNGCFDVLHLGHIEYLAKARELGQILIVGLNSDDSVRRIKGAHRPVNNEEARAVILAALSFVDAVVVFDTDTPIELIKFVQPDILVKGKDYEGKEIVGSDVVKARGGHVVTIELTKGYSTSHTIELAQKVHV
ncbi:MAG: D-glycero-beta-D-manno-heptose 1-phosphate adenylyltransferase [Bacteroidota bacterium]